MYVIRPKRIRGTPQQLARDLHCQTRRWPNAQPVVINYNRDFLMVPVPPQNVLNSSPDYHQSYNFMTRNKYGQRRLLEAGGIPVPRAFNTHTSLQGVSFPTGQRFVVRPLHHSGGRGYRVTDNPLDFSEGTEYISVLYPKKREYRIIFVFGKPLIVLRKKPNDGVSEAEPWGHVNSVFQTINDIPSCRLSGTDCFTRLSNFDPVKGAHIVAADILYNKNEEQTYVVLELNNCPGLDIDNNRAKVVEAIRVRQT